MPPRTPPPTRPPLARPRACLATGVAEGLGTHLGVPADAVRFAFVLLVPFAGAGVLLYLWLWATMPWADAVAQPAPAAAPTRRAPVAWVLLGLAAVFAVLTVASMVLGSGWMLLAPAAGAFAVAAASWTTFVDRVDPARGPAVERLVRLAAFAVPSVMLVLLLWTQVLLSTEGVIVAMVLVVEVCLVFAPPLAARVRELGEERTRRVREEQRSEIAAHLHDSVLQTLALIQRRAGASSEVARIARAQERELRDWLHAGDVPREADLGTDVRDFAAALEIDYPVTFDVVEVGASAEGAHGELAAATREAMLNAARHAGGEVSVYLEGGPDRVDVFVRDRGPGFDPAGVPGDRLGVRESIVGRMRRAGGSATVAPGAGGVGTEVHLAFGVREAGRVDAGGGASGIHTPPARPAGARAASRPNEEVGIA
ncbi:ATP-binding protein [Agromyces archimandritae]|uniref:PspC domain-containing protein n=1 Tax=Agromyces archimandritae TaxID=2781962 RepID=A0A975FJJ3_9MICO|nr:ATP-binding protein [Agromyces archimandritae]QTX03693.1 PspC domain-containing protein [Agromyces archimandritae]